MLKASNVFASPRYARTENLPLLAATLAMCRPPQGTKGTEGTVLNGETEEQRKLISVSLFLRLEPLPSCPSFALFSADTTRRDEIRHRGRARRGMRRAWCRSSAWPCRSP